MVYGSNGSGTTAESASSKCMWETNDDAEGLKEGRDVLGLTWYRAESSANIRPTRAGHAGDLEMILAVVSGKSVLRNWNFELVRNLAECLAGSTMVA